MSYGPHDCRIDPSVHIYQLSGRYYIIPCSEQIKLSHSIKTMWSPNIPEHEGQQIKALSFGNHLSENADINWSKYRVSKEEHDAALREQCPWMFRENK